MGGLNLSLDKTAQAFGVDPRTVKNWIAAGLPGEQDASKRWTLNTAQVAEWLRLRERKNALGEIAQIDEQQARRRKLAAEAALAEHELAIKQGSAVSVADAGRGVAVVVSAIRAKLLGLGNKLGPVVAIETEPLECQAVIDAGVHEALLELSQLEPDLRDASARIGGLDGGIGEDLPPDGAATTIDSERVGGRKPKTKP